MTPMSGQVHRTATMRDVAALAGVGLKTVSRVVNRESGVSGALAERVEAAVALLGYRHNLAASSLRRSDRRTATIGLLLDDVSNPFDSGLQRAVEDVARRHGSLVLASSTDRDAALESGVLQAFASRKVDGIIALPAGRDHRALLHELRVGRPVVFVDRPDTSGLVDSVVVDNVAGAALAVRHLVAHGHRRVGLLCDHEDVWTAGQRLRGFREGMVGCGLAPDPALVRTGISGSGQARDAVRSLLERADPPTAVFTGQNLLTVGAVDAIRRAGGGVALVGFDDFPVADLLDPAVTVVSQDVAEIGRTAAELLFERLGGSARPAVTVVTEPRLVVRGSGELPGPADGARAIAG